MSLQVERKFKILGAPYIMTNGKTNYKGIGRTFFPDIPQRKEEYTEVNYAVSEFFDNSTAARSGYLTDIAQAIRIAKIYNRYSPADENFHVIQICDDESELVQGARILGWDVSWNEMHSLISDFLDLLYWKNEENEHKEDPLYTMRNTFYSKLNSNGLFSSKADVLSFIGYIKDLKDISDLDEWHVDEQKPVCVAVVWEE